MAGQSGAQLDIGRVISRTFATLGANAGVFFLLALLFGGLPAVLVNFAVYQLVLPAVYSSVDNSTYTWMVAVISLGSTFVLLIPTYVLIGALTHGAIVYLNGGRASLADCLGTGVGRSLPLIALGFLSSIGLGFFFLLLIIPGIVVATRWAVAAPSLVTERTGIFESFGRSGELARDNRWRIFWLMVIWLVIGYLFQIGFTSVVSLLMSSAGSFGDATIWIYYVVIAVYSSVTNMIGATGSASLYCELRTIKEGATSDELAKVFE